LSNKTIIHAITNQNIYITKDNRKSHNIDIIYEKQNLQDEDRGSSTLEINVIINKSPS
jgi:hypothetical protein